MPSEKIGLKDWILGFLYGIGIVIAGSEGKWFPWFNFAGVFIVGIFMLAVNRMDKRRNLMMKKAILIFGILLAVCFVAPAAQAVIWYNTDQATVAWDAPTKFTNGPDIPAGVILEYEVFTAMLPDKSDKTLQGRTANLIQIVTMGVEGQHYCGVQAIRIDGGKDVSKSAIAWSDNPDVCGNNETFGIQFYLVPDLPSNLYKQ